MREFALVQPKDWLLKAKSRRRTVTTDNYTAEEKAWDTLLQNSVTTPHYMQSSPWGESKAKSQWPVSRYVAYFESGVLPMQVFSRTVPGLGRLHYAPEVNGVTIENIQSITQQLHNQYGQGMTFKMELYQPYSEDLITAFKQAGWVTAHSVQHRTTVRVDLSGSEEAILNRMKNAPDMK